MLLTHKYHIIEQIGQGGMGVVYRVVDRLTGRTVALKKVTTPSEQLEFASSGASVNFRVALAHEFRVLASLRHPHIISVLDYGFDLDQQPYFTMELLENRQTILEAGRDKPLEYRMALLLQTIQALIYLHRRNIIHRDLKPDNVVVLDEQVKVVDFGLAVAREYVLDMEYEEDAVVGTLAYMAPEVLQSAPATEQSDLYALGVMAYELIAGKHPFDVHNISNLIQDTVMTAPDVTCLPVGDKLRFLVDRLLAKSPEDRYDSALSLYDALVDIIGQTSTSETPAIRRSFLEAAAFIGRDAEINQLLNGMERTLQGTGSLWLVGGESGVGKSRLLEELRIRALSRGAMVLRGQAVATDGNAYEVWREVLRRLCLHLTISDFEASVLKALVPDIALLLGRAVVDAEEIDPAATQLRLFSVIESLLKRVTQPLLILLEDLHWARDSLLLVRHLQRLIGTHPVMIVGSFRNEEAPELPKRLPDATTLTLSRLNMAEIDALSRSILGEIDNQAQVVEFLHRETEGNVFFIIEILRELAEESGKLADIGTMTLPDQVFAGEMLVIVQRRLDHLPEQHRWLLHRAALGGRELDLDMMGQFIEPSGLHLWLMLCENYQILEVQENVWRFSHDKLREGAVLAIPPAERCRLHGEIGDALVAIYGEQVARAAQIAYHFRHAEQPDKEARYSILAGKHALTQTLYDEAQTWFNRALDLAESAGLTQHQLARIEQYLTDVCMGLGEMDCFVEHSRRALAHLGFAFPRRAISTRLHLMRVATRQLINTLHTPNNKEPVGSTIYTAGIILQEMGAVLHVGLHETIDAVAAVLHSVNLLETVETTPELVNGYASLSIGLQSQKLHRLSSEYLTRAERLVTHLTNQQTVAIANMHRALGYAYVFRAQWEKAERSNQISGDIYKAIGDLARYGSVIIHQSITHSLTGNIEAGRALRQQVYDDAVQSDNLRAMTWGLVGMGQMALYQNDLTAAEDAFSRRETLTPQADRAEELNPIWSYRAALHWRRGEQDLACKALQQALSEVGKSILVNNSHDIYSLFNMAEVALGLLENDPNDADLQTMATQTLDHLRAYRACYIVGEPRLLLYTGLYKQLTGDFQAAQQTWIQTRQRAQALGMPFEQGLAYAYSGKYTPASAPQRESHLKRARQILHRIGAWWDLAQVEKT